MVGTEIVMMNGSRSSFVRLAFLRYASMFGFAFIPVIGHALSALDSFLILAPGQQPTDAQTQHMRVSYHHLTSANIRSFDNGADLPSAVMTTDGGFYMINLLSYLHQSGAFTVFDVDSRVSVDSDPKRDELGLIITHETARDALPVLSAIRPSNEELRGFYEKFARESDPASGPLMNDHLRLFVSFLERLPQGEALVLAIR